MTDISLDTIYWGTDIYGDYYPLATPLPMNYPLENVVLIPTVYGYANQYTGTLAGGGVIPDRPTLVLEVRDDETGITAIMSGEMALTTNQLQLMHRMGEWVDYGTDWDSINEMSIDLTETGVYYGYITSTRSGFASVSQLARIVFEGPSDIQADDTIPFVFRNLRDTGVYWPPETNYDKFGVPIPEQPIQVSCRYEENLKEIIDVTGTVRMSKAQIYSDRDLETGGIFMLGTLDDVDDYVDPKENDGAWEIITVEKIPNLKRTKFLRLAYL